MITTAILFFLYILMAIAGGVALVVAVFGLYALCCTIADLWKEYTK